MFKKKLGNKGFAITSVLYTLLVAFLLFLGAALAEFSTSAKLLSKANEDLTDGFDIKAVYIDGSNKTESTINISDFPYTPPKPSKEGHNFKKFKSKKDVENNATISCDTNALGNDEVLPITYGKLKTFLKENKCTGDIKIEYKADFEQTAVIPIEYNIRITYTDENGGDILYEDKTISSGDSLAINRNIKPGYEITYYTDRYKTSNVASLECKGGSTYVSVGLPIDYDTLREKCTSDKGTLELRVTYAQIDELANVAVNVYYWLPRYSTASSGFMNEISSTCGLYYSKSRTTNIYKTVTYGDLTTINEIYNTTNNYYTLKYCNAKFTLKDTNGNSYNSPTSYTCAPITIKSKIKELYNQNSKPQLSSIDLYVRRSNDDSGCRTP